MNTRSGKDNKLNGAVLLPAGVPTADQLSNRSVEFTSTNKAAWLRAAPFAIAIFLAVNFSLWFLPHKEKASKEADAASILIQDFQKLGQAPNIVLLGSSLMMYPFWSMDRLLTNYQAADMFHHHRSLQLEQELDRTGLPGLSTFSFASGGQMASDSFLFANSYLKGKHKPQILIYGIAPRDFGDYCVPDPMSTPVFKRVVDLSNFADYAPLFLPGFDKKMDFLIGHVAFLYNRRWRFQRELNKTLENLYIKMSLWQPETVASTQSAAGVSEGHMAFVSQDARDKRWQDSEREYRRRYKNIDERDIGIQYDFLNRTLTMCRERGIQAIIINMPLSQQNRVLMPAGFYARYRKQTQSIVKANGFSYIDLGDSKDYAGEDFFDTVHLGHMGGYKLLRQFIPAIKKPIANY